jgi:hypothetical protein
MSSLGMGELDSELGIERGDTQVDRLGAGAESSRMVQRTKKTKPQVSSLRSQARRLTYLYLGIIRRYQGTVDGLVWRRYHW